MTVPKYYEFYNAFLEYLSNGQVAKYNDCKEYVKHRMNLSEKQLSELSESGGHIWENRVGWCATYLKNAGLVVQPKREQYQITDLGLSLLNEGITITDKVLEERCPMFLQFKKVKSTGKRLKKPEEQVIDAEKIAILILDYRSYVCIHVFASLVRNCHFTPKSIDDDME